MRIAPKPARQVNRKPLGRNGTKIMDDVKLYLLTAAPVGLWDAELESGAAAGKANR